MKLPEAIWCRTPEGALAWNFGVASYVSVGQLTIVRALWGLVSFLRAGRACTVCLLGFPAVRWARTRKEALADV